MQILQNMGVKISMYFIDQPISAVYGNDHCLLWVW